MKSPRYVRLLAAVALAYSAQLGSVATAAEGSPSARLKAKYEAIGAHLRNNDFGRPMVLASAETPREVRGEIYAVFDHPFESVKAALDQPAEWCDVLLLPINSKFCRASGDGAGATVSLGIGKGNDRQADNAQVIALVFQPQAAGADHFAVRLVADAGPVGTSDYRILIEAIPIDSKRTFLHFNYAYSYGFAAKVAMQAYLGTAGRNKIGFSVAGQGADGAPQHVSGMRGVVERNVMRYYLAIEAALHAMRFPAEQRLQQRLDHWFTATEAYPRQLREMSRTEYLALKTGNGSQRRAGS